MIRQLLISALLLTPGFAMAEKPQLHNRTTEQPKNNGEMAAIFAADQKARQDPSSINWNIVGKEDEQRRKRTLELLNAGALKSGDDFSYAAFVFQHGGKSDDYLKAHLLAMIAVAKGNRDATWIAAATLDRYLQNTGHPQVLGTQFSVNADGKATQEPFDRALIPDSLRTVLGVPGLGEQEKRREAMEKDAVAQFVAVRLPALKSVVTTSPPRTFDDVLRPVSCDPIPGSEQVLNRSSLRWIVVGEMHGTNETPADFANLACLASLSRPVTVAVEQPRSEQAAIDDFVGSDGGSEATSRFLQSAIWTQTVKDGRSSQAYFRLFQRLRQLRAAGRIKSVVAFQPFYTPGPGGFDQADYENVMASTLIERSRQANLTLVLVGNLHAMQTALTWAKPPYVPMAGYLPVNTTITLDSRWNGGSYWACTSATDCGRQSIASASVSPPRGIVIDDRPRRPYSGALNLGGPATASPPQVR